ncbi:hypothetical protein [Helicobacter turcicus]|uniref:Periplasmic protein n=1 Tax=Helicobacter turcicus TaxID=2867412 RepID=A0ABS7JP44_9HELI|nr:hypothetical protein [Helicobacter turcicus]MBX7491142.1 hypothetical protein [Helicobacter turcicus]MBX7546009.1 hypothetical protein [Helicobacter turcicus]
MHKGIILLPLMLFVILGAFVLILSTKFEQKSHTLEDLNARILWLDLHLVSIKEALKIQLKNKSLTSINFTELSLQIGDYHYIIVLKQFTPTLMQTPPQTNALQMPQPSTIAYYFVDVFGIYRDSSKEFLQEFSTRRNFILSLEL